LKEHIDDKATTKFDDGIFDGAGRGLRIVLGKTGALSKAEKEKNGDRRFGEAFSAR
jgi:hypothetical protein